jgi:hypothetical protein
MIEELYFTDHWSMYRKVFAKVRALTISLISKNSSKAVYFRSLSFIKRLKDILSKNIFDMVFIDHAEMLWSFDCLPADIPVIHLSQNVENILYREYINRYSSKLIIGSILRNDALKYELFERKYIGLIKNVITVSTDDSCYFSNLNNDMNVSVINPFFSYSGHCRPSVHLRRDKLILGFLANMEWWPNRDAFAWLSGNILPHLSIPYELRIYGNKSENCSNGKNIVGKGFVKDLAELWDEVDLIVNPIVSGGGVNIKVAEAIYNKMAMICTQKALRGLDVVPDKSIVIRNTPDEWIEFLNFVYKEPCYFAESTFDNAEMFGIEQRSKILKNFIDSVVNKGKKVL